MIVMKFERGKACPMFLCDICEEVIGDYKKAAVAYGLENEGVVPAWLVHKGACHNAADAQIGLSRAWIEMGEFLVNVLHNSGMTMKVLEKQSKQLRAWERIGL